MLRFSRVGPMLDDGCVSGKDAATVFLVCLVPRLLWAGAGIFHGRRGWRADVILYAILLGVLAVGAVYRPATQLRAPMEFVLMIFSASVVA